MDALRPSYSRFYTADALYSYKICGVDKDGRLRPLTITSGTGTTKTVNTAAIRPNEFYYYASTTTKSAGTIVDANVLYHAYQHTTFTYNFNSTGTAYREIYLKGTLDSTTGLFTLDTTSATSWYVLVPYNTTITLSSYFTSGSYYILLGRTYSSANYYSLFPTHPLYRFNGTNLVEIVSSSLQADYALNADKLDGKHASDFQPAGNYLTSESDTLQTVTNRGNSTTNVVKIQNGAASGAFVLGADVNAQTLTANTRKLGRMGVPSYDSTTKTVAGISFDSQPTVNYADFGGHPNNAASIAPDVIRFIVANSHDNTVNGARTLALQISKQAGLVDMAGGGTSVAAAKFFIPVQTASSIVNTGTISSTQGFIHSGIAEANRSKYLLIANGGYKAIDDFALATDVSDPEDYYWANVKVSKTSSTATAPTFSKIIVNDANATNHITFQRSGWSYVAANASTSAAIAFIAGNTATAPSGANASLAIKNTVLLPGLRDNEVSLGGAHNDTTYHFKNLYLKGKIYNGDYNYTLPSKTGTLALTSELPNMDLYMPKSGGQFTGPISFKDGTALPSKTLQYIIGIDAFASGGQAGWQSKADFLSGYVTGSGLTADTIVLGGGSSTVKTSSKKISTSVGTDDTTVPTSKAVKDYVTGLGYITSDTKVTNTLNATTKYYVTGTTSAITNTGTQIFDTAVYVNTTAGALHATTYNMDTNATMKYDSATQCIRFVIN